MQIKAEVQMAFLLAVLVFSVSVAVALPWLETLVR